MRIHLLWSLTPGAALLLSLCLVSAAEPLDRWHWRSPSGTGNILHGIGASPTRYVAVGELGSIIVSDNGTDWWTAEGDTSVTLRAVTWGDGQWVAVGDFGEILTSPDAVTWNWRPIPWFFDLAAVTWGDGQFVAVGQNTAILTSPDGIEWTLRSSGSHPLRTVAWANGLFLAGGGGPPRFDETGVGGFSRRVPGQPLLLISMDGVSWTRVEVPVEGQVSGLSHGSGRFVAATTSRRTAISFDGMEWLDGYHGDPYGNYEFYALAYLKDRFIGTYGNATTILGEFMTSVDGVSWAREPFIARGYAYALNFRSLAVNSHGIAAVGQGFFYWMRLPVFWSADARQWTAALWDFPDAETQATFAGGLFFLRETADSLITWEESSDTTYLVSPDGQVWDRSVVSESEWFGLPTYGDGLWVAGGERGRVASSTNAVDWQIASARSTNQLIHSAFEHGTFFLTGAQGTMVTSMDGLSLLSRDLGSTNTLGPVVWHNGIYAVAEPGTRRLYTSPDSVNWHPTSIPGDVGTIVDLLAWPEGFLVLARTNEYLPPRLLSSQDGHSWVPAVLPSESLQRIAVGADYLLAFRGPGSRVFHSRRAGETGWTTRLLPWTASPGGSIYYYAPADVAFGNGTFLLTHGAQFILQSDPLTNTAPGITQPIEAVTVPTATQVTLRAVAHGSTPLRYQWRLDGTNLPSATTPYLAIDVDTVRNHPVTVIVENDYGSAESDVAGLIPVEPASIELSTRLNLLRVQGTPRARYQIETSVDPASPADWTVVGTASMPSSGASVTVKNLRNPYAPLPSRQFYRAVAQP